MAAAWVLLDPADLAGSLPKFLVAVQAIVSQFGRASASGAMSYYLSERAAAGVTGRPSLPLAPDASPEQIAATVGWALKDVLHPATEVTTPAPVAEGALNEIEQASLAKLDAAVEKLVLDQGRQTIIDATNKDKAAKGWARVTEPGACSFCLLLATRGAVYKTEDSASFQSHDHCQCHAEPLFGMSYEPTAQVRAAQAIYKDVTKGRSGNDARVAFRQAMEGRPVTGTTGAKVPAPAKP